MPMATTPNPLGITRQKNGWVWFHISVPKASKRVRGFTLDGDIAASTSLPAEMKLAYREIMKIKHVESVYCNLGGDTTPDRIGVKIREDYENPEALEPVIAEIIFEALG